MAEPLLTIEEATREFRVSPKTIRRRLVAGEIDGAYKRPGSRGPEWVMPRGSLAAAGFVPRPGVEPSALPEDEGARSEYWERRALDAEAALAAAPGSAPPPAPGGPSRRRWVFALVAFALVAFALGVLLERGGSSETAAPGVRSPAIETSDPVRALLERLTDEGEQVGVVGDVDGGAVPPGREAVAIEALDDADGVRYLVAGPDGAAVVEPLASVARPVLRLPDGGGEIVVYDLHRVPDDDPPSDRPDTSAAPTPQATVPVDGPMAPITTTPQHTDDGTVGASAGGASGAEGQGAQAGRAAAEDQPAVDAPAPTSVDSVTVRAGDSFWSIAEDLAVAAGAQADVASVWVELIDANADRLIEPGNPDLLHVGQVLTVPGAG